jgi:cyclophilin family peptidyl-prolyl cis-trans isomerase
MRPRHLLAVAAVAALVLASCGGDDDDADGTGTAPAAAETAGGLGYGTGACPPDDVDEPVRDFDDAPGLCIDPDATYTATFVTSEGDVVVELATDTAPLTVNNFVVLARYHYYDDTPIFRSDPTIDLWQAGGENNTASPGYTIPDEGTGYTYEPGTLAMARTSAPNSAGGQFFITTGPLADYLKQYGTYVVFGHVTEGLDVAQAITALGTPGGTPSRDITLETVTITES